MRRLLWNKDQYPVRLSAVLGYLAQSCVARPPLKAMALHPQERRGIGGAGRPIHAVLTAIHHAGLCCTGTGIPGPRACFGLRSELAVAWRPSYCDTPAFALLLCCTPASDCCLICSKMHHPLQLRSNPAQSSVGLWPPGACYMSTSMLATNRQRKPQCPGMQKHRCYMAG